MLFGLIGIFNSNCIAQEKEENEVFKPHHKIGISINNVHVFESRDKEANRKVLNLPAWELDWELRKNLAENNPKEYKSYLLKILLITCFWLSIL